MIRLIYTYICTGFDGRFAKKEKILVVDLQIIKEKKIFVVLDEAPYFSEALGFALYVSEMEPVRIFLTRPVKFKSTSVDRPVDCFFY